MRPRKQATLLRIMLIVLCSGWAGCSAPSVAPRDEKPNMVRGDRSKSAPRRSSEERPKAFIEEKGPFETDRSLVEQQMARGQESHQQYHSRHSLKIQSFSHPACDTIPQHKRSACPLAAVSWSSSTEVPGGAVVRTKQTIKPTAFRLHLICHVAYGQAHSDHQHCPLHQPGIRLRLLKEREGYALHLLTSNKSAVPQLRAQVKKLLN